MGECRNCGSTDLEDVGFVGEVAPFFLKRVCNLETGFATSEHPLKRMFRHRTKFLRMLLTKLYRPTVSVELQSCNTCLFLQTKVPYSDEAIKNLYFDYRSESYNKERIEYEPSYAKLAGEVGIGETERLNRVNGLTAWLGSKIDSNCSLSMLDYGGADGGYLPHFAGDKYVFDLSDTPPVAGVVRIDDEAVLNTYSYVQVAHVLEHVPFPLALVKGICSHIKTGGYLYTEVPQEIDEAVSDKLKRHADGIRIIIHEHINRYTPVGIVELFKSAGLEQIAVETEMLDFGWTKTRIIRGLARKTGC